MRLSFRQFLALALFPLVGMMACDVPLPAGGTTTGTLPDLSNATTVTGTLSDGDGTRPSGQKADEAVRVSVPPGATLHVLMESEAFDTFLEVRVDGLPQVLTNDDWNGSRQQSFVSQTNTTAEALSATVFASAYAQAGRGAYTVRYLVETPAPLPEAEGLRLPAQVSGTLTSSTARVPLLSNDAERPADVYSFTLASGQRATVRMESSAFDTYLKVLRNGAFSARNDDFGGSRSVSQLDVSGPGTITVLAGAFSAMTNTGSYTLSVTSNGAAPRPKAEEPQTPSGGPGLPLGRDGGLYNGELTDSDPAVPLTISEALRKADAHHIELRSGETLIVAMESQSFDTYLKMERSGQFVARNDDAGSTSRSEIRHTATTSGTYTVYAGTFADSGRGQYQLSWRIE
ncbi:MAG: hypothetical protein AAGI52_12730 [Bacteroidota bacterium]